MLLEFVFALIFYVLFFAFLFLVFAPASVVAFVLGYGLCFWAFISVFAFAFAIVLSFGFCFWPLLFSSLSGLL